MNLSDMKRALAEAEARAKLAEDKLANNGRKGFSIRESDKVDRDGPPKLVIQTGVQNWPVTVSVSAWEAILTHSKEIKAEIARVRKDWS